MRYPEDMTDSPVWETGICLLCEQEKEIKCGLCADCKKDIQNHE